MTDERREDARMREIIERVSEQAAAKATGAAVPAAIETTLKSFGFDTSDPVTIQKNQAFLNESRQRCERFYGTMWDQMIALFWRVLKIVLVLGLLALAAKLGLQVDALNSLFGAG